MLLELALLTTPYIREYFYTLVVHYTLTAHASHLSLTQVVHPPHITNA
jgi:hypothetical protein